jgi:hypothetical protein
LVCGDARNFRPTRRLMPSTPSFPSSTNLRANKLNLSKARTTQLLKHVLIGPDVDDLDQAFFQIARRDVWRLRHCLDSISISTGRTPTSCASSSSGANWVIVLDRSNLTRLGHWPQVLVVQSFRTLPQQGHVKINGSVQHAGNTTTRSQESPRKAHDPRSSAPDFSSRSGRDTLPFMWVRSLRSPTTPAAQPVSRRNDHA